MIQDAFLYISLSGIARTESEEKVILVSKIHLKNGSFGCPLFTKIQQWRIGSARTESEEKVILVSENECGGFNFPHLILGDVLYLYLTPNMPGADH